MTLGHSLFDKGIPSANSVTDAVRAAVDGAKYPNCPVGEESLEEATVLIRPPGVLRVRQIAAFAFAMTCAGPFGLEDCVRNMGAPFTMLGFFFVSIFYVVPQIFMTSELSMTLPISNGGVATWVARAFGPVSAACVSLNMLLYQLVDLATYPSLAIGYAESVGYDIPDWVAPSMPLIIIAIGFLVNLLKVEVASDIFTWLLVFILAPCLSGIACAMPHFRRAWQLATGHMPTTEEPPVQDFGIFLSTMLWLNTGWDSMGNLASNVASPKDFVGGQLLAAFLTPFLYASCTFAALGAGQAAWGDGYLAEAYGRYYSPLAPWVCFCAGLANLLLYTSEFTTVVHLIQSMADPQDELRLLPRVFACSPAVPIIALTLLEGALMIFSFQYLVQLSTLLHVFALWFALAAYIRLKYRSDLHRAFTVPWGRCGAWAIFAVKAPVLGFLLYSACASSELIAGALGANLLMLLTLLSWSCRNRCRATLSGADREVSLRTSD